MEGTPVDGGTVVVGSVGKPAGVVVRRFVWVWLPSRVEKEPRVSSTSMPVTIDGAGSGVKGMTAGERPSRYTGKGPTASTRTSLITADDTGREAKGTTAGEGPSRKRNVQKLEEDGENRQVG